MPDSSYLLNLFDDGERYKLMEDLIYGNTRQHLVACDNSQISMQIRALIPQPRLTANGLSINQTNFYT